MMDRSAQVLMYSRDGSPQQMAKSCNRAGIKIPLPLAIGQDKISPDN